MGSQLSDVVGILDMDGFMINKRFRCKELGLLKVGDASARSVFFDIGISWNALTAKDRKTCEYAIRNIHKLPFGVPFGVESSDVSELGAIVSNFYHRLKRSESSGCIQGRAYRERLVDEAVYTGAKCNDN